MSELSSWLVQHAYPCWWSRGIDRAHGGFHESLRLDGCPSGEARRARLYPRQMYAFSLADELGWKGPAIDAVRLGFTHLVAQYRGPAGLYRSLVDPNGTPLTEHAVLYDQAFVLLGFAAARRALALGSAQHAAYELRSQIEATLRNPFGGFMESSPSSLPLLANSHMHLLEACLQWMDQDTDRSWRELGEEIVELALRHFHDPVHGFIREYFTAQWAFIPGADADLVEPGHQYEWAWLLLRWSQSVPSPRAFRLAFELIDRAESCGVDSARGVVVNALFGDGRLRDARARLWPQTERIKALHLASTIVGGGDYEPRAEAAVRSLMKYLDVPVPGLWWDTMDERGVFVDQLVPASSFYHIVSAVRVMESANRR